MNTDDFLKKCELFKHRQKLLSEDIKKRIQETLERITEQNPNSFRGTQLDGEIKKSTTRP